MKWSVWGYVHCRKLGDSSSPDAADAYINRHQYLNIVGNLNCSEVDDSSVDVQSDLWFLGAFATLRKSTVRFVMSVGQHGTTWLPLDGFSWNLSFQNFSRICWEKSSFIKIGQEQQALYMKTKCTFDIKSRSYLLKMRNVSAKRL